MAAKGVLLDIDGVLYVGDSVIDGAVDTVELLKAADLPLRFLTNTTTKPGSAVVAKLNPAHIIPNATARSAT